MCKLHYYDKPEHPDAFYGTFIRNSEIMNQMHLLEKLYSIYSREKKMHICKLYDAQNFNELDYKRSI